MGYKAGNVRRRDQSQNVCSDGRRGGCTKRTKFTDPRKLIKKDLNQKMAQDG